jgi:hypothetical protein
MYDLEALQVIHAEQKLWDPEFWPEQAADGDQAAAVIAPEIVSSPEGSPRVGSNPTSGPEEGRQLAGKTLLQALKENPSAPRKTKKPAKQAASKKAPATKPAAVDAEDEIDEWQPE